MLLTCAVVLIELFALLGHISGIKVIRDILDMLINDGIMPMNRHKL